MESIAAVDDTHMRGYLTGDKVRGTAKLCRTTNMSVHCFEVSKRIEQGLALGGR